MEPLYFGVAGRKLFGVYHPAHGNAARQEGIVFCAPMGQEYVRSHRTVQQMAVHLAQAGFHCLRFDYYGCGDSDGSSLAGSIRQWQQDIDVAIEELREGCGVGALTLVGLRLGGILATLVAARRKDVSKLVLWDTVVAGTPYLEELYSQHRAWLRGALAAGAWSDASEPVAEVLGFPLPASLAGEISVLNLDAIDRKPAERAMLLASSGRSIDTRLVERFQHLGTTVHCESLAEPAVWLKSERDYSIKVVSTEILKKVVAWISSK